MTAAKAAGKVAVDAGLFVGEYATRQLPGVNVVYLANDARKTLKSLTDPSATWTEVGLRAAATAADVVSALTAGTPLFPAAAAGSSVAMGANRLVDANREARDYFESHPADAPQKR